MPKKAITWTVIAFLIFLIVYRPAASAIAVKDLGGGVADVARGFKDFFLNLVA
jgi:hypothetical protein